MHFCRHAVTPLLPLPTGTPARLWPFTTLRLLPASFLHRLRMRAGSIKGQLLTAVAVYLPRSCCGKDSTKGRTPSDTGTCPGRFPPNPFFAPSNGSGDKDRDTPRSGSQNGAEADGPSKDAPFPQ